MNKFWILILITGCTRNVLNLPGELLIPDNNVEHIQGKSIDEARSDMARTTVTCESDACNSNAALMVSIFQKNEEDPAKRYFAGEACTASVVKVRNENNSLESYFLTAGHCIPKRFLDNAMNCAQDMSFVLANGQRLPCESVTAYFLPHTSDPWLMDFDLALVKATGLDKIEGSELSTKALKVSAGQAYSVKVIGADIEGNWYESYKAKLKSKECFQVKNTFLLPNTNNNPMSPLFTLRACGIKDGYSGAPVYDGGTVVGVVSFNNLFQEGASTRSDAKGKDGQFVYVPVEKGLMGAASNVACFDAIKKTFSCDASTRPQRVAYVDKRNNLDPAAYLDLYMKGQIIIKDQADKMIAENLKELKTKTEAEKIPAGFSGPWVYKNFPSTNSSSGVRIAIPKCYSNANLAKIPYKMPVLTYEAYPQKDLSVIFMGRVNKFSKSFSIDFSGGRLRIYGQFWTDWAETEIPRC